MCRVAGPRLSNTPCRPALHPAPLGHCSPAAFGPVTSHSFSTTAAPTAAAEGVRVTIHYVGTLDDGQGFDSSEEDKGGDPLVFDVGEGRMIRGIDNGVRGMTVGESREIRCEPADAYGERDPQGVQTVEVSKLPDDVKAGDQLQTPQGQRVTVTKVEDGQATVDFNHPLAGQALNFSVKLIACAEAPQVTVTTLSPGDGVTFPSKGDSLTMHYTGSLAATGAKFDSSVDRGMPFKFTIGVGQVIQGWDKGVMKMSVGEKARLEIPSDLGYGERGAGERIPPNADLVFEVELLKIN
jgi:FK506-binding protein 1